MQKRNFRILTAIFLFFTLNVYPQWESTNGPYGEATVSFTTGDTLWVAAQGIIFMTTDEGENWQEYLITSTYPPTVFDIIKVDSVSMMSASDGIYIFNGEFWQKINYEFYPTQLLYVPPRLWAINYSGVYYSDDKGITWQLSHTGSPLAIFEHNGTLFVGDNYNCVLRSTDNGNSWNSSCEGLEDGGSVQAFAYFDDAIFASVYGFVYKSTDNGDSWSIDSTGFANEYPGVNNFYVDEINGRLFAASEFGVFMKVQSSGEWQPVKNEMFLFKRINSITTNENRLFAVTEGGVFCMENVPDGNWAGIGVPNTYPIKMCEHNNKLYVATYNHSLQYTEDAGRSWHTAGDIFDYTNDFACSDTTFFVATISGLWRYNQSSSRWIKTLSGSNISAVAVKDNTVYISIFNEGVKISHDGGVSWESYQAGLPTDSDVIKIYVTDNYVFASVSYRGLYRRSVTDNQWHAANAGIEGQRINALYEKNGILYAGGDGFFSSDNWGDSWQEHNNGLWVRDIRSVYATENAVLVGTVYNEIYISRNNSFNWEPFTEELNPYGYAATVTVLFGDSSYIYAGMLSYGIWRRPLTDIITDTENDNAFPKRFILQQNYPNPFNPTTTIKYTIPSVIASERSSRSNLSNDSQNQQIATNLTSSNSRNDANVRLIVYNILGEEVATLVNERQAPGNYSVQFDASNLPSGVYFYTLRVGDFTATKKMLLLK